MASGLFVRGVPSTTTRPAALRCRSAISVRISSNSIIGKFGTRGFTRTSGAMASAFSANSGICSCDGSQVAEARGNADGAIQFFDGADGSLGGFLLAQAGGVFAQQLAQCGRTPARAPAGCSASRAAAAGRCRRRACSASRRRADTPARAPAPRRHWKTPGRPTARPRPSPRGLPGRWASRRPVEIRADDRDGFFGQAIAQRMAALIDGRLARRQRKRWRCRPPCRLRWRASSRRCRYRPSLCAGR